MADWATISSLATAGGTLILAVATFASVRSAHRAARAAERTLLAGLRPILMPSRLQDPPQKIIFIDAHYMHTPGGGADAHATDEAIYLAMSLRNAGSGIALLHGWTFHPDRLVSDTHADPRDFHRLTRDIYVPAGDLGFWQGTLREPTDAEFRAAREAIEARRAMTVDLLYSDHEGGQRMVSRFGLMPRDDGGWLASAARHWNLDRADPR
jgi:hypothetical protein